MVTEKTTALAKATMTLAFGGSAQSVIQRYDDCRVSLFRVACAIAKPARSCLGVKKGQVSP